jgi:hypothetical protein
MWFEPTWPVLASWVGIAAAPVVYDYGTAIVYRDNTVYVNGAPTATAEEYAAQASTLAARGSAAEAGEDDWRALGVFALVQGTEKTSNELFQLAVNPAGVVRGNYYNALADTTLPVSGSVDKKTQRVAWTIDKGKSRVFETGLANLTKGETAVLVHFGKDATQQWSLVRVDPPEKKG